MAVYNLWKRYFPRSVKKRVAVFFYDALSRMNTADDLLFLNHGYAALEGPGSTMELNPDLEKHRYPMQLYSRIADLIPWEDQNAVEISCGRGGGTAFVMDTKKPAELIGIDLAGASIDYCAKAHKAPGLSFQKGDAMQIPLDDASCDTVLNVESSFNYPDFEKFIGEVDRVLRPGGHFLIGDYRRAHSVDAFKASLDSLNYDVIEALDVSPHIIRALKLDSDRKVKMIQRYAPKFLHGVLTEFAFANTGPGSDIDLFERGQKVYWIYALRKPSAS
jgi:ubiquinone/menaquinone biosynthesis C-methylase UbiE